MIKKALSLFYLLLFIKNFCQSQKLIGEWFLDKIIRVDKKNLEINNSKYSMFLTYKIAPNELKILDLKFKAKFYKDQIQLENRTLKYWFEDPYLLVQENNEVHLFLKPDDFINKYPEFKAKTEVRNNKNILVGNQIIHPNFNYEQNFDNFLSINMTQESSKNMNDLYFKAEYILTKENKITHIQILDKRTPQYDTQFVQTLKKAEQYLENPYGVDMLVTVEKNYLKWYNHLVDKSEKELYDNIRKGSQFYDDNKFEKAIAQFSKLYDLKIKDNRFKTRFHDAYIKLGISYLAVGKNDEACTSFRKAGDLTDFELRNYLIDFCK